MNLTTITYDADTHQLARYPQMDASTKTGARQMLRDHNGKLAPLVAVKSYARVGASRYTGYVDRSIRLDLVCGHRQYRKASDGVPSKARCIDCLRLKPEQGK